MFEKLFLYLLLIQVLPSLKCSFVLKLDSLQFSEQCWGPRPTTTTSAPATTATPIKTSETSSPTTTDVLTTSSSPTCEEYNSCIETEIGASSQSCSSEQSDQCKTQGGYCGDPSKCQNDGLVTGNMNCI